MTTEPMSDDSLDDIFNDTKVAPTNQSIREVSDMVEAMKKMADEIDQMTVALDMKVQTYRQMVEKTVPEAVLALGVSAMPLADGTELKIEDVVQASIKNDNKPAAYAWLITNGYGDMIKKTVEVSLGREAPQENLEAILKVAKDLGYLPETAEKVEPATLTAFVRRMYNEGKVVPKDIFTIFQGRKAVIKEPKKKGAKK